MLKRWLVRLRGPFLYLLVIAGLVVGAYYAPLSLRNGLESYQPLQIEVAPAQSLTQFGAADTGSAGTSDGTHPGTTAPLTNRVVLVVVNGLSQDDVETLPAFQNDRFKNFSTGAYLFTGPVQPTTPALVTLLTGATGDLTGGFTLDPSQPNEVAPTPEQQLAQFDNLFNTVKRSKFTTALFGTPEWYLDLPQDKLDFYATFDPRAASTDIANSALDFLKRKSANFTLIQLNALGQAQQDFGNDAPQMLEARQDLNAALEKLTGDDINLKNTTLIITGDWGTTVKAGDRWTVPLLMIGQAVQPGDKIWGRQEDVASTIAALLGVEIPRQNQGGLLGNLLSMPAIDRGEKFLALVEQRLALDTAYRTRLGLTLPLAINDPQAVEAEKNVKVARQNYQLGSYDGIEQVVEPVLRYTRSDMEDARQEWFSQARWQRALLAVAVLALPLLLLLIWRSALALLAIGGALIAAALPYGLYWLQGDHFAFNSTSLGLLQEGSFWRAGIALFVGLLVPTFFFDWAEKRRIHRYGQIDLGFQQMADLRRTPFPLGRLFSCCALMLAWLVYFSAVIWFAWYYWRYGYFLPLTSQPPLLPDYNASFLQFFAVSHLLGFALGMVVAPLVLVMLYWLKRRMRGDHPEEEEEPDMLKKPRPNPKTSIIKA